MRRGPRGCRARCRRAAARRRSARPRGRADAPRPSSSGSLTVRVRALGVDGHIVEWQPQGAWTDIRYETSDGVAKITIDRPEVRNAFRPLTTRELIAACDLATHHPAVGG